MLSSNLSQGITTSLTSSTTCCASFPTRVVSPLYPYFHYHFKNCCLQYHVQFSLRYYHQSDKFHNLLRLISNEVVHRAEAMVGEDVLREPLEVSVFLNIDYLSLQGNQREGISGILKIDFPIKKRKFRPFCAKSV